MTWDKTNIQENYPGVTTPLTYSFIQVAYAEVYLNFMRHLGVHEQLLEENQDIFNNMVGYIHGQVYYNIDNWYRLLQLLPGYQYNKQFFETMLNPVERVSETNSRNRKDVVLTLWRNRRTTIKLVSSLLFISKHHKRFDKQYHLLSETYHANKISTLSDTELIRLFNTLSKGFFKLWVPTILNDFKTMIAFGLLTKLVHKTDKDSTALLQQTYGLKDRPTSLLPLTNLQELSKVIRTTPAYSKLFSKDVSDIQAQLTRGEFAPLNQLITTYISLYGERAPNELKLESLTFQNKPDELISLLKQYIKADYASFNTEESNLIKQYEFPFIKRLFISVLRKNTLTAVYKREQYRLQRAKVFQFARDIFIELGKRLAYLNDLESEQDVFYLYQYELFNYMQGHTNSLKLKELVSQRKAQLKIDSNNLLPTRIETTGYPNEMNITSKKSNNLSSSLSGKVTSIGEVTATPVVVMPTLDLTKNVSGKVLVTISTDPGWTILFPLVKGIITENGGVLSHAAIVARELGIPCIVGVKDATTRLHDGDVVSFGSSSDLITLHIP